MASEPSGDLQLIIEFSGGAEILVGKQKEHTVKLSIEDGKSWTIRTILPWIVENLMTTDRKDLFVQNDTVRPGILVLVNETDWELLGELNYEIKQNDTITFISTLHGG